MKLEGLIEGEGEEKLELSYADPCPLGRHTGEEKNPSDCGERATTRYVKNEPVRPSKLESRRRISSPSWRN